MGDRKGKIGKSLTLIGFVGIGIMTKTLLWAKSWSLPPPLRVGSPHFKDRERQPWESLNKKLGKHVKKQMGHLKWPYSNDLFWAKCESKAQKLLTCPSDWSSEKISILFTTETTACIPYSDLSSK